MLTEKKLRFVAAYLGKAYGNGQKAAELAGYAAGASARVQACRLLKDPEIVTAITSKRQQIDVVTELTVKHVLDELAAIAFSDVRDLFDDEGRLRPVGDLEDGPARALAAIDVSREKTRGGATAETVVRARQWDKLKALELIAKLRGMLVDKHEHRVVTPKPVIHEHVTIAELEGGH